MTFPNFKRAQIIREVEGANHPRWLKPSVIPLTIVCGPPASGKSFYVRQHRDGRDVVIDFDAIALDIFGEWRPRLSSAQKMQVLNERNRMLAACTSKSFFRRAFFIACEPEARWRSWWWQVMRPAQIIVCATSAEVCRGRLRNDRLEGDERHAEAMDEIDEWWRLYTPFQGDTLA